MLKNKKNSAFTLVEVMVVSPIIILIIGVFVSTIVNMTGEVLSSRSSNKQVYDIQDALDRIEKDIKLSESFLATNSITPLQSPQGYDNETGNFQNASSSNGNSIILKTNATTKNPNLINSGVVYLNNSPNACSSSRELLAQNSKMSINIIYFVKNKTLWRRVIMPSNYETAGCDINTLSTVTPWQQPSCDPTRTDSICKSKDVKLVEGIDSVNDFNIDYYNNPDSTTENSVASDNSQSEIIRGTSLSSVNTAVITIKSSIVTAGRNSIQAGTIRAVNASQN